MYEQNNNTPSNESTAQRQDAIDINDFVFAATGARVRRLTMPDGTHWFPAVDVCKELGYANSRKLCSDHVPEEHREILETVLEVTVSAFPQVGSGDET